MAEARKGHGVAALHGEVWAVGGLSPLSALSDDQTLASVEVYSPQRNAWRRGVPLPHGSALGTCAVVQCS